MYFWGAHNLLFLTVTGIVMECVGELTTKSCTCHKYAR